LLKTSSVLWRRYYTNSLHLASTTAPPLGPVVYDWLDAVYSPANTVESRFAREWVEVGPHRGFVLVSCQAISSALNSALKSIREGYRRSPDMMPPSVEEIDRIARVTDPILRNLRITQCYHELSQSVAERTVFALIGARLQLGHRAKRAKPSARKIYSARLRNGFFFHRRSPQLSKNSIPN
jgi:hypothetical protein